MTTTRAGRAPDRTRRFGRVPGRPKRFSDVDRLSAAPRVSLADWPTPVETVEVPDGARILVKRDDLSGLGRGGAKARKIEHLVGHLLAHGYDELVTVAGNVTNLAFDLLPVLSDQGVRPTLFIADDPPAAAADREILFRGIRDRVTLIGPSRRSAGAAMARAWLSGRAAGRRPFLLPPGGSHPAGVVGNACGFLEMARQLSVPGRELPGAVYVSAATGTTLAGFLLAEHALRRAGGRPIEVVGVQVYPGAAAIRTLALLRWTERALGFESRVPLQRIRIVTSALHGGFGRYPASLASRCRRSEADLGFALDPIFGGKTWSTAVEDRRPRDGRPVLFWHCGWTPEWPAIGRAVGGDSAPARSAVRRTAASDPGTAR